jgi:putative copper resistance protein D
MAGVEILVRLAQYGLLSVLFGLGAMSLYARTPPLSGPRAAGLAAAGAVATLASLALLAVNLADDPAILLSPSGAWSMITVMAAGIAGLGRVALLGGMALVPALRRPWPTRLLSGLALASLAWSGHAAAGEGVAGWGRIAADMAHLLAAGVWLGALVGFVGLARRAGPEAANALARFSGVGGAVVAVLAATGLINLFLDSDARPLTALTAGPWGWLLLAKLGAFAAMLALAAANRFVLTPRLRDSGAAGAIRLSLALETALGLAVLILVAVLGRLSPLGDG